MTMLVTLHCCLLVVISCLSVALAVALAVIFATAENNPLYITIVLLPQTTLVTRVLFWEGQTCLWP